MSPGESPRVTWSRELMSYLPENFRGSPETVTFQEALQPEVDGMWEARNELLAQLDPYTATWGLGLWEEALGIKNSLGLDLDLRRRQVVAKLQGRGTTTVEVVETLAGTLLGVPCKVTEIYGEYRFELEPDPDEAGGKLPAGAAQLRERLEEIIPAHLGWQLVVTIWLDYIIGMALGPRRSASAPKRMEKPLPGCQSGWDMALGPRWTTTTPDRRQVTLPGARSLLWLALGPRGSTATPERWAAVPAGRTVRCSVWCGGAVSVTALPGINL